MRNRWGQVAAAVGFGLAAALLGGTDSWAKYERPQPSLREAKQAVRAANQELRGARSEFRQGIRPQLKAGGASKADIKAERRQFLTPFRQDKQAAKAQLRQVKQELRWKKQGLHGHKPSSPFPMPTPRPQPLPKPNPQRKADRPR